MLGGGEKAPPKKTNKLKTNRQTHDPQKVENKITQNQNKSAGNFRETFFGALQGPKTLVVGALQGPK